MGQAKRRGTFEERKAQAIERNAKIEERVMRQKRSKRISFVAMLALGMTASSVHEKINDHNREARALEGKV